MLPQSVLGSTLLPVNSSALHHPQPTSTYSTSLLASESGMWLHGYYSLTRRYMYFHEPKVSENAAH